MPTAAAADTVAPPSAAPIAPGDTVSAPMPAHVHPPEHRDCVEIGLAGGLRLNVHPGATSDHIKRVVEALRV